MAVWTPEVVVSPEEAAALIAETWPDLAGTPVVPLGAGFDNTAYRVGAWVFRFPRRAVAIPLMEREIRFLPTLAAGLVAHAAAEPNAAPLPGIPAPERVSAFKGAPFAGYRHLDGRTACSLRDEAERAALAAPLGAWLGVLHTIPVPADLGPDLMDRANLFERSNRLFDLLSAMSSGDTLDAHHLELIRLARVPAWSAAPRWVHGDLYARHLLVENQALTGVIDWGDTHAGDPALDLSVAWTMLPRSSWPAFQAAYERRAGPIDAHTWDRARFHAWRYFLVLIGYVRATDDAGMARIVTWTAENLGVAAPRDMYRVATG